MALVCVIGGGVGGLAVAARLAAKRHDVTLLEQSNRLGGQLHTANHDGFAFDIGPSMLTLPAVFRDLFLKTGRPLEDEVDLKELEPGFRYQFADQSTLALPGGSAGRTTAAVSDQFGAQAGEQWRDMTGTAAKVWRQIRTTVLTEPVSDPKQVAASIASTGSRRSKFSRRTPNLDSLARDIFTDPRLVQLVDDYASRIGADPRKAPESLITQPFVEQAFGLWHLRGGMGQLAEAMVRRCESLGVRIKTETEVTKVTTNSDGVTGVRCLDGSFVSADVVVSDVDATYLHSVLLAEEQPKLNLGRRFNRRQSYSQFIVQLGVRSNPTTKSPDLPRHLVWLPQSDLAEFDDLRRGKVVRDPTIRATIDDNSKMAPPGHESWCLKVNAPRQGHGSAEHDWANGSPEWYADQLIDLLATRGVDLRDRIVSTSIQTPSDFATALSSPGGSLNGIAMRGSTWILDRPSNISPIPGLYLVGGTTHPGPGLPYVGLSAEIVAEAIGRAKKS